MTENELKNVLNKAGAPRLLSEEKQLIKSSLILFLKEKPIIKIGFNIPNFFNNLRLKVALSGLSIMVLAMGSTSALAEGSLPGTILYPVKVNLNEPMKEILSFSHDAKTDLNIKLAGKRLVEAERLADLGQLSQGAKSEIKERLEKNFEKFERNLRKVEASNGNGKRSLELSSDFEAALKAHQNILSQFSDSGPEQGIEVEEILKLVGNDARRVEKIRKAKEALVVSRVNDNIQVPLENKQNMAENKVEEVSRFLSENQNRFGSEFYLKAGAKLDEAREMVREAEIKMNEGKSGEAFAKFQEAIKIAKEAELVSSSAVQFEARVRNVRLERESENELEQDN